jgi:hypothetical protein
MKKIITHTKKSKSEPSFLNLGTRMLNKQHQNRTLVIPKIALSNCGCTGDGKMSADIILVQESKEIRYIKVTPRMCEGDMK